MLLIRNGFGIYAVSFISYVCITVFLHGESVPLVDFFGHTSFIIVLSRLMRMIKVFDGTANASSAAAVGNEGEGVEGLDVIGGIGGVGGGANDDSQGWSMAYIVILISLAACLASFLFGIAVGRSTKHLVSDGSATKKDGVSGGLQTRKLKLKGKEKDTISSTASLSISPNVSNLNVAGSTAGSGIEQDDGQSGDRQEGDGGSMKDSFGSSDILYIPATSDSGYEQTITIAKSILISVIGLPGADETYSNKPWSLVRSGASSHLWVSRAKADGILLRGTSFAPTQAKYILKWLNEQDLVTGIEGISHKGEVIKTYHGGSIVVRRITCRSGSLTSSKRDFILVTSNTMMADGTFIVASRSVDIPSEITQQQRRARNGYIRGVVYGSGYVLRPVQSSDGIGCEIFFAAHLDMLGSPTGRMNMSKTDILAGSVLTIFDRIQENCSMGVFNEAAAGDNAGGAVGGGGGLGSGFIGGLSSVLSSSKSTFSISSFGSFGGRDSPSDTMPFSSSPLTVPPKIDCPGQIGLSSDQMHELLTAAKGALAKIRKLHKSYTNSSAAGSRIGLHESPKASPDKPGRTGADGSLLQDDLSTSPSGGVGSGGEDVSHDAHLMRRNSLINNTWDTFYEQDGIAVSELMDQTAPIGVLSAFCATESPPSVVRKLLIEHPEVVDGLLVGRSVLNRLNPKTYVQWLAYGAIWPVGARDFLVVTSEETYETSHGSEGFCIVSTSIDDICEEVEEDTNGDGTNNGSNFTRSRLKLAGYVGVPNKAGGTDLTMFVDVDVYAYTPAWLVQVLAQYGLSEMMSRIKRATSSSASMQQIVDRNQGFQLNKILEQIHTREAKMRQLESSMKAAGGDDNDSQQHATQSAVEVSSVKATAPSRRLGHQSQITAAGTKTASDQAMDASGMPVINASFFETIGTGKVGPSTARRLRSERLEAAAAASSSSAENDDTTTATSSAGGITSIDNPLPPNDAEVGASTAVDSPTSLEEVELEVDPIQAEGIAVSTEAKRLIQVYLGTMKQKENLPSLMLDWQTRDKKKGVSVQTSPVAGNNWNAIKATTIINSKKEVILNLLLDDNRIGEFDDMFDTCKFLVRINDKTTVRRVCFKAIWPTAPRDFLVCTTWQELEDGSILVASRSPAGCFEDLCPQQKNFVRGFINISGYWIQPAETLRRENLADGEEMPPPGTCKVTLTAHSELGGTLPSSVINMLSTAAPLKILSAISEICSRAQR